MKRNLVTLKSNQSGLILLLDPECSFEELLQAVEEKFLASASFFKNARVAITFRGRVLSHEEERQVVNAILENGHLQIACILEEDPESGQVYQHAVEAAMQKSSVSLAEIHYGTIANGEKLESDHSLLILGDVKPQARIISGGSIFVLGKCMGHLQAGAMGDSTCVAAALMMRPASVRIADRLMRSAIVKKEDDGTYAPDPKLFYIADGHMKMEALTAQTLQEIIYQQEQKPESTSNA